MAKKEGPVRKRGRPALPPEQRRRHNVTIRLRDKLRSEIQEEAAQQGRSLSEEIETRLEKSLEQQRLAMESWGGGAAYQIWRACAQTALAHEAKSGKPWLSDSTTFRRAQKSTAMLLDLFGAKGQAKAGDLSGPSRMEVAHTLRRMANEIDGLGLTETDLRDQEPDPTVLIATRKILKQHLD